MSSVLRSTLGGLLDGSGFTGRLLAGLLPFDLLGHVEVFSSGEPLLVLLLKQRSNQPVRRSAIRKDPDHPLAAADLLKR